MATQQTQDSIDTLQGRLEALGLVPRDIKLGCSSAIVAALPTATGGYIELEYHHLYSGQYIIGDSKHCTLKAALASAGLIASA